VEHSQHSRFVISHQARHCEAAHMAALQSDGRHGTLAWLMLVTG
jgi:hypothetical protein